MTDLVGSFSSAAFTDATDVYPSSDGEFYLTYTAVATATADTFHFYLSDWWTSGSVKLRLRDSSGNLLDEVTITSAAGTGLITGALSAAATVTSGNDYILGFICNTGNIQPFNDNVNSVIRRQASSTYATAQDPLVSGSTITKGQIQMYVSGTVAGPTVTQTDTTPTDNVLQTINSTDLTVAYTAASVGGASILAGLSNTDPTTASTYTQNNFVTVEGPVSRISEAVNLSVTATGGTATQSITIGPATGLAVVTLTSVDRTTGAPDSNMILEIEATGETVAIGDQFYYETADNTSITAAGVPTSDAVTFDLVLIQGSATSANGVPFTINTASVTAPTLTLPTSASITKTGATIGCTTDESGGTMYFYISVVATATSATVIANGETQTVSATGIQTKALTGLVGGTNYYGHLVQVDSDTETSNVVNTTQFTTLALDAPVLATTSSFNKTINVAASGQLVQTGGDTATSWSNPAGADGAQYTITSGGVWTRTANNPTIESEVFTTTATNSGGTSGVQTVTVTYTETTTEISGEAISSTDITGITIQSSTI